MLAFTRKYGSNGGRGFTGHLSFDFMMKARNTDDPQEIVLYPIECNPRAHTAVALFAGTPEMSTGCLSALETVANVDDGPLVTPRRDHKYYWVGHDLVTLVILPSVAFILLNASLADRISSYKSFFLHLLVWKDGTYETWDPLPWWWLYYVYWPIQFLSCIRTDRKWSRINVSTTKMFEC